MHIWRVGDWMCFVLNFNKKEVADVRFLRKKYANSDFLCKFATEYKYFVMKRIGIIVFTCLIGLMTVISSCDKVEFKDEPKSFNFATQTLTLKKGEIRPLAYPLYSTNYHLSNITFEVDNTNVVYIDEQMQLQATNLGQADLRAFLNGEQLGIMRILVREP